MSQTAVKNLIQTHETEYQAISEDDMIEKAWS